VPVGAASPAEREALAARIDQWAARELERSPALAAVDRAPEMDRWYLRMRGEDKAVITVWLTLGELTLHYETHFMPAPEENIGSCFEYLLRCNAGFYGMRFALGDEDAVYLVGQIPVGAVDEEELDRLLGSSYAYVEQCFSTAMSIGFASRYRRR
jgi:hypothetical protein